MKEVKTMLACIDVSSWQGEIDFEKVRKSGISAVILRIGFGNLISQKDLRFDEYYTKAKKADLKIGGYYYSYAKDSEEAELEAKICYEIISNREFDLPIFYDLEEENRKYNATNKAIAFCNFLKAKGYKAGVYSNYNWFKNYLDYEYLVAKYPIWLADWSNSNHLNCDIWQYSETGRIDGINGNVDLNYILNTDLISTKVNLYERNNTNLADNNNTAYAINTLLHLCYQLKIIDNDVNVNTVFDDKSVTATKQLQQKANIYVDGIAGFDTITKAYELIAEKIGIIRKIVR